MGHRQLGRLPRVRGFKEVIDLLDCSTSSPDDVARTILRTASDELDILKKDQVLTEAFWHLVQLTWAARGSDFGETLSKAKLPSDAGNSLFALSTALKNACSQELDDVAPNPATRELAVQALQATVHSVIGKQVPSLFNVGPSELQQALASCSTKKNFSILSRTLVSDFLGRVMQYVTDRHEPGTRERTDFDKALSTWSWETSKLVERFSGDWYSKHNWQSKGDVSKEETSRFVAFALEKLRREIGIATTDAGGVP